MMKRNRISTDGGSSLQNNPFAGLELDGLPEGPGDPTPPESSGSDRKGSQQRGRVDIIRQTAHRGGKTVTLLTGFSNVGLTELESLAKRLQKTCGTGGTVKDGNIELQGDQRSLAVNILKELGFRPILAGG